MKKILLFTGVLFTSFVGVSQMVYSFTACGVTGEAGPTQTEVNTAYTATNLNGMVTINTQGIPEWTVPVSGT